MVIVIILKYFRRQKSLYGHGNAQYICVLSLYCAVCGGGVFHFTYSQVFRPVSKYTVHIFLFYFFIILFLCLCVRFSLYIQSVLHLYNELSNNRNETTNSTLLICNPKCFVISISNEKTKVRHQIYRTLTIDQHVYMHSFIY